MDVCFTRYNKAHLAQSDTALFLEENLAMSLRTLCGPVRHTTSPIPSSVSCSLHEAEMAEVAFLISGL